MIIKIPVPLINMTLLKVQLGTIHILRQQRSGSNKIVSFADVQYCIYADLTPLEWVGGSEKVQNYADVI